MVEAEGEVKESSAKLSRDPIGSKRIDKQNRIEDLPSQGIKRRGINHRGIDDPAKGKRVRLRCLSIALSSSIVPYRANRPGLTITILTDPTQSFTPMYRTLSTRSS